MKKLFIKIVLISILLLLIIETAAVIFLGFSFVDKQSQIDSLSTEVENLKKSKDVVVDEIIKRDDQTELEAIQSVPKQEKNVSDLKVIGWIPDWGVPDGLVSLQTQKNNFTGTSPVWFWINADGSLKKTVKMNDPEFIAYAKANNIELIPTITQFDADILSKVLNNETAFNRHIDEIMSQVNTNNYDGIDLDYESVYLKDKEKFFALLEQLALKLAEKDKKFVFTVLPKWGDDVVYRTFPETKLVFDYKRIAELVDEFRIMTYEYTGRTNKYYGPIAPLPWIEDVIKYAIYSGVPRSKIVIGINTYAYDYSDRTKMPKLNYYPVLNNQFTDKKPGALAYFQDDVEAVKAAYNGKDTFEETWGESIFDYTKDGAKRILVYPSQKAIDARKKLAAEYGIGGVVYWKVGNDGNLRF